MILFNTDLERMGIIHTKRTLTPVCLSFFDKLKTVLPAEISSRLKSKQKVGNHGNSNTWLIFDIWDKHQTGILPKDHFKYCLGYDHLRVREGKTSGYFHLWLNTIRIYKNRVAIKELLEYEIIQRCPKGVTPDINPKRFISAGWDFDFPDDVNLLPEMLIHRYVAMITAIHPILMQVIDVHQFTETGVEESLSEAVGNFGVRHPGYLAEYSRSISKALRAEVVARSDGICAHCDSTFSEAASHIDHILPFSKGGRTILSNLQALCAPCNLFKGNRFEH